MGVSQAKTKKASKAKSPSRLAVAAKPKSPAKPKEKEKEKDKEKDVAARKGLAGKRGGGLGAGEAEVPLDRRKGGGERRGEGDRRQQTEPVAVDRRLGERRAKVPRRRQIDPTTCERDYSGDEIEFMHALDAYKRANGRMFPTCSEILEVIRGLGYRKLTVKSSVLMAPVGDDGDERAVFGATEADLS